MNILVSGIEWDTDGEEVELPSELTIDAAAEGIDDPDSQIADWLSDRYGWAVIGFSHEPAPNGPSAG